MAAQRLNFYSNFWSPHSSSSTSTLQRNQYLKPNTINFQHKGKRPRPSSASLSISPSSCTTVTYPSFHFNNNNNSPLFEPLYNNNNSLFSHQSNNGSLFPTTTFYDVPLSPPQTLTPLVQQDYYHQHNSLDFLDEYPNHNAGNNINVPDPINPEFSSLEDQILLAPFLTDPPCSTLDDIIDCPAPLQDHTIPTNEDMVVESSEYYHHRQQKKVSGEATTMVSPQSIAARERRRKISERTSELGKLIPGGSRMSTAEMFQAAYKYVKFLKAQVSVLQLLSSQNQEMKEEMFGIKELQILASPIIQEKLYSEEKCMVPRELVDLTFGKN